MKSEVAIEKEQNTDFETRSLDTICVNESHLEHSWVHNIKYSLMGIVFGIILVKAEVISLAVLLLLVSCLFGLFENSKSKQFTEKK